MIQMIRQKMKNKRWLTVCLLLGMSILVAACSCQPMFRQGSLDKLLFRMFEEHIEEYNQYPTVIGRSGSCAANDGITAKSITDGIEEYRSVWRSDLEDITFAASQTILSLPENSFKGSYNNHTDYLSVGYIPKMEDHIRILAGTDLTEEKDTECYPCLISESVMDELDLVVDEVLEFKNWTNTSGEPLKLKVSGIFKESDSTDLFWYQGPNDFSKQVFVDEAAFDSIVREYQPEKINYLHFSLLDFHDIRGENVEDIAYYIGEFQAKDAGFFETVSSFVTEYQKDEKTVTIMLWVLELPIFGMVLAFIFMVSKQVMETEKNEIAMQKSRGISKRQVIYIYVVQFGLLAAAGLLLGIPLGYLLCKLAAGTTDFLTFSGADLALYRFTPIMLPYGIGAALVGIVCLLIPAFAASGISIVEYKNSYTWDKKMVWEKFFLDFILLAISLYLLYNFNKNQENIRLDTISGNQMDPMIFLDATLFIAAFGLLALRLTHYLVRLIYRIGRKKWKPAAYASFLQITRTFARQGFVSVFLIITVSMGLFNANAARTINRNKEERIVYENGADAVLRENWNMSLFKNAQGEMMFAYEEPDFVKYQALTEEGLCESCTRVIVDERAEVSRERSEVPECMLLGINTKEFGETAYLDPRMYGDTHWFHYLNDLGQRGNGVIISENLAEKLGATEGSTISVSRYGDTPAFEEMNIGTMQGYVCHVVKNWPGYSRYYYEDGECKERYLVVANYARVQKVFRTMPYEVWFRLSDGVSADELYERVSEMDTTIRSFKSVEEDIDHMKNLPMIQITNGMFTLSFLIALLLCAIGFLIYWISSIRQRELLFGVYRAMGMSVKNVNQMLLNEHIFSTLFSVIAGGVVGVVATFLYVRLFGIIYLPEKHNVELFVQFEIGDVIKLFSVIFVVIVICLIILRKLIKSLDITQALKLGEE